MKDSTKELTDTLVKIRKEAENSHLVVGNENLRAVNTLTYKDYHYLLKLVLFAKLHDRRTPEYHQELLEKLAYWEGERERIETEKLENE